MLCLPQAVPLVDLYFLFICTFSENSCFYIVIFHLRFEDDLEYLLVSIICWPTGILSTGFLIPLWWPWFNSLNQISVYVPSCRWSLASLCRPMQNRLDASPGWGYNACAVSRSEWFGHVMFRAGLRPGLASYKARKGKVLPGIRWCNKVHCWNLILILHPSVGTGVQKLGQHREHILNSEERLVVKISCVCVLVLIHSVWVWAEVDSLSWASLNMPNTSTRGICGFPVRIGRNSLGVIVPRQPLLMAASHPTLAVTVSQTVTVGVHPPSLCFPPYGAKASLEMAAQMCCDVLVQWFLFWTRV